MLVPPNVSPAPPALVVSVPSEPPADATVYRWDDLPAEEILPGITMQAVHGGQQSLIRYCYQPGSVYPVHSHPQEQITIVVRGQIAFDIAGERQTLGPGQLAVIPGGVPHGAAVLSNEAVETFNSLSPRRPRSPVSAAVDQP